MTTLLICGSREMLPGMADYARRCVQRAAANDWYVICGDAEGIDDMVMQECHRIGLECVVYGAYSKIRRRTPSCSVELCDGDYLARDRRMVDDAEMVIGIWNGSSRGTKYTCDYAQMRKTVWLKDFSK